MRYKKIMILSILLVSLLAISAVSAVDLNTTDEVCEEISTEDANRLELSLDDSDEILSMEPIPELQNLINNANDGDVIQLTKDYDVYGYVNVNKSVTIDGNTHKINFDTAFRFYVYSPSTIKNIQMVGYGDNDKPWGSIESEAPNLIISNCKFINIKNTGPIVYSSESNLTLDSCEFTDCSSNSYAQAYSSGSNLKVTNTDFINNNNLVNEYKPKLKSGAPLCIFGNDAIVSNCNFINNTGYSSGAIRVGGNRCYITDCTFTNNNELYTATIHMGGVVKTSENIYNGATLLEVIKTGTTAAAIEWDGDDGVLENPIFENNQGYTDVNFNGKNGRIIESAVKLKSSDVIKFYGGSERYIVTLTDKDGVIANANVKISVNGKTSTVTTNSNGQASLDLNLPVGTHNVVSEYDGNSITSKVTVKSTIAMNDFTAEYSNSKVTATFLDTSGNALASKQIIFKVGDKTYTATTNSNGVATANVDLDAGTYILTAINPVNNEQKSANLKIKAKTKITSQKTTATYNDDSKLVATLTYDATGKAISNTNIVFKINDAKHTVKTDSKGQAKLSLNGINPDEYTATISYAGNSKYTSSSRSVKVIVGKADTSISATINNDELVATLTHGVTGKAISGAKIVAKINGKDQSLKTDSKGQATFTSDSSISAATVSYAGNAKYNPSSKTVGDVTDKASISISASKITANYNDNSKLVATLTNSATGKVISGANVKINLNGVDTTVKTDSKGQAKISTNGLSPNTYTATISYAGNSKYKPASKTVEVVVNKATMGIYFTDTNVAYNSDSPLIATLTNSISWTGISGATVKVNLNGKETSLKSDYCGDIYIPTKGLAVGTNVVTISYAGNAKYHPVSTSTNIVVTKANVNIFANGDSNQFVSTLTNAASGKAISGANVKVNINGNEHSLKTDSKGQVKVSTKNLNTKTYTAVVSYAGNAKFNPVSTTINVDKDKMPTIISLDHYENIGFAATLSNPTTGKTLSNAYVKFDLDGDVYTLKTYTDGQAVLYDDLTIGSHEITVSYGGNSKYAPSSSTTTINQGKMNIIISSVYNEERHELITTLMNGDTGDAVIGANVEVNINGATKNIKTNSNGQFTVSTSKLAKGTCDVTISYKGNSKYNPISAAFKVNI